MESLKAFQITQSTITEILTDSMKQKNKEFTHLAEDYIQEQVKDFKYEELASRAVALISQSRHIPKQFCFTLSMALEPFLCQDWSCYYRYMGNAIEIHSKGATDDTLYQNFLSWLEEYFQYESKSFSEFLANLEVLFPDARIQVRFVKSGDSLTDIFFPIGNSKEGASLAVFIQIPTNREACLEFCLNK
jgi:ferritin